jgi:hypothetical protein
MIYGILSCLFSCMGPVGIALGGIAWAQANQAIADLPNSRRAEDAEKHLQIAKVFAGIGMCLSGIMIVFALILNFASPVRR